MVDVDSGQVSRIITNIYEAAYDQSAWTDAVENLCGLFHGSKACLARIGPDLQAGDSITTSFDPKFHQLYIDELADLPNPLVDAVLSVPVGTVYHDHTLLGDKLKKTVFWNEWMAPQNMHGGIASKLMASGPSFWIFDVQRGQHQEKFDTKDIELLQHFAPHLIRATEISRRFRFMQPLAAAFSYLPFGVVLVDGHMQIITSNPAADAILSRSDSALRHKSGTLLTADTASTSALRKLVAQACSLADDTLPGIGGDLLIRSKSAAAGVDISLSVGPLPETQLENGPFLQRCAAIFIREITIDVPVGFEEQVRNLFSLTAREASLAASLASGRSVKEAAKDAGIAYSTMRTYLENVFRKTETRQQSQLVALLRSLQPPIQR